MTWVRANFDRVAVIAGIVFLFLCAFFIWRNAEGFAANFASLQPPGAPKAPTAPAKALELEEALKKLAQRRSGLSPAAPESSSRRSISLGRMDCLDFANDRVASPRA